MNINDFLDKTGKTKSFAITINNGPGAGLYSPADFTIVHAPYRNTIVSLVGPVITTVHFLVQLNGGGAPFDLLDNALNPGDTSVDCDNVGFPDVVTAILSTGGGAPPNLQVLLLPSDSPSLPLNVAKDGIINPIAPQITGAGSPKTIKEFHAFISKNPTTIHRFKVDTTDISQLSQILLIKRKLPFKNLDDQHIDLSKYTSEKSANTKMVTIDHPFQLDDQTEVSIMVPPTTTSIFTFYIDTVLSLAKALEAKNKKAERGGYE